VLVDAAWLSRIPAPKDYEDDLLEALDNREETSRLSCQIALDDHLDGLRVSVPTAS
jgi:2Fe-2S ferredoxin